MARPVTLFTGQWADLTLEDLAKKAASWGYDGLELACWGDHFEVDRALAEDDYCDKKRALLKKYGLEVYAISTHLVGQNVDSMYIVYKPTRRSGQSQSPRSGIHSKESLHFSCYGRSQKQLKHG